jgi:hypothetical protein
VETETQELTRGRKRDGAKSRPTRSERTVKVALMLTPNESRALGAESVGTGKSYSAIVGSLITQNCRRWVLSDRGEKGPQTVSTSQANGVNNSVKDVPTAENLPEAGAPEDVPAPGAGESAEPPPAPRRRHSAREPESVR